MGNVLIVADTESSPEMRHQVPLAIGDPFVYGEVDGAGHVALHPMELARLDELGLPLELHPTVEFGTDQLRAQGLDPAAVLERMALAFCRRFGIEEAVVPDTFPVRVADYLRGEGVALSTHPTLFAERRRAKTSAQLAGIRRAQTAAHAGMGAVAELLRRAEPRDGVAVVDGEPLTSERLRHALLLAFLEHDTSADTVITAHGPQAAVGHHPGSGPIGIGESVVVDIWPRDNASACYTDMTRTFVVGEPPAKLAEWQRVVKEALDAAVDSLRPGVSGNEPNDRASEIIEGAGFPTVRTKKEGEPLRHGFFHGLGHGVGLQVHEAPSIGYKSTDVLVAGDVVTIEPGLYDPAYGGCRLEDILLITETGAEKLTDFPYDLTP